MFQILHFLIPLFQAATPKYDVMSAVTMIVKHPMGLDKDVHVHREQLAWGACHVDSK
jgi:hypothetical protein